MINGCGQRSEALSGQQARSGSPPAASSLPPVKSGAASSEPAGGSERPARLEGKGIQPSARPGDAESEVVADRHFRSLTGMAPDERIDLGKVIGTVTLPERIARSGTVRWRQVAGGGEGTCSAEFSDLSAGSVGFRQVDGVAGQWVARFRGGILELAGTPALSAKSQSGATEAARHLLLVAGNLPKGPLGGSASVMLAGATYRVAQAGPTGLRLVGVTDPVTGQNDGTSYPLARGQTDEARVLLADGQITGLQRIGTVWQSADDGGFIGFRLDVTFSSP